jgi:metallo-beta-lactamase family protein
MYLEFHGAAGEVTGSCHRLHVGDQDIVLDCGLFQGRRAEANRKNRELPQWAIRAQALVLSHAHLDHSGSILLWSSAASAANIFCTPATRDLCSVMLRDAALLQDQDARYINRHNQRDGLPERVEPLYEPGGCWARRGANGQRTAASADRDCARRRPSVSRRWTRLGFGAGEPGPRGTWPAVRLLFTGDLGRTELPLLGPPEVVSDVDVLLMESTYGDRNILPATNSTPIWERMVRTTIQRGGRVYIPTFALERAQEVLFALARLHGKGQIPGVPIYVDSPLAIAITEIYKLHPEGLAPEVRQRLLERDDAFSPPGLHYISQVGASRQLQTQTHPCIIIAGSGMCEGGRILHHFATGLAAEKNSVIIVGFMAKDTLGRRLLEGRTRVKVFGVERDVRATVHYIAGLSAHADQADLVRFCHADGAGRPAAANVARAR